MVRKNDVLLQGFRAANSLNTFKVATSQIAAVRERSSTTANQLREDIARCIRQGQGANILSSDKINNLIGEENLVTVYDLIDQYCHFIIKRFRVFDTKRDCPSEMREPITSIIYAASRCPEIEELGHIKEIFTTKYGPEFVANASEIGQDHTVNSEIIWKLSTGPVSREEKVKLIKEICNEYGIEWPAAVASPNASPHSRANAYQNKIRLQATERGSRVKLQAQDSMQGLNNDQDVQFQGKKIQGLGKNETTRPKFQAQESFQGSVNERASQSNPGTENRHKVEKQHIGQSTKVKLQAQDSFQGSVNEQSSYSSSQTATNKVNNPNSKESGHKKLNQKTNPDMVNNQRVAEVSHKESTKLKWGTLDYLEASGPRQQSEQKESVKMKLQSHVSVDEQVSFSSSQAGTEHSKHPRNKFDNQYVQGSIEVNVENEDRPKVHNSMRKSKLKGSNVNGDDEIFESTRSFNSTKAADIPSFNAPCEEKIITEVISEAAVRIPEDDVEFAQKIAAEAARIALHNYYKMKESNSKKDEDTMAVEDIDKVQTLRNETDNQQQTQTEKRNNIATLNWNSKSRQEDYKRDHIVDSSNHIEEEVKPTLDITQPLISLRQKNGQHEIGKLNNSRKQVQESDLVNGMQANTRSPEDCKDRNNKAGRRSPQRYGDKTLKQNYSNDDKNHERSSKGQGYNESSKKPSDESSQFESGKAESVKSKQGHKDKHERSSVDVTLQKPKLSNTSISVSTKQESLKSSETSLTTKPSVAMGGAEQDFSYTVLFESPKPHGFKYMGHSPYQRQNSGSQKPYGNPDDKPSAALKFNSGSLYETKQTNSSQNEEEAKRASKHQSNVATKPGMRHSQDQVELPKVETKKSTKGQYENDQPRINASSSVRHQTRHNGSSETKDTGSTKSSQQGVNQKQRKEPVRLSSSSDSKSSFQATIAAAAASTPVDATKAPELSDVAARYEALLKAKKGST